MVYNAAMDGKKRKYMVYLNADQAQKLEAVYQMARKRDGRTNISEVMRELMGFPVDEGKTPVTYPEDRDYLSGRREFISERQYPAKPSVRPRVRAGHE